MNFLDMGIFLALALAILSLALFLVLPAFLHPRPPVAFARSENIAAARARLRVLRQQYEEGALSAEETAEYETEIKQMLVAEVDAEVGDFAPPAAAVADKKAAAFVCAVLVPGALALYFWFGTPGAFFHSVAPAESVLSPSLEDATAGLRRYIASNPQDSEALALMGRALTSMSNHAEAAIFFARARKIQGDTLPLLKANIQSLLLAGQNANAEDEVDRLLQKALALSPQSEDILLLAEMRDKQRADGGDNGE